MTLDLRWYQDEAIDSIFRYFSNNAGNPVVALPTGTGKSLVIGGFQQRALGMYPTQRFINLTHVKELVEQNARKMVAMWPGAPVGVNSAGLKQRDVMQSIIFAGIASIAKNPQALGHRDLAIIDECHLVSPNGETMYRKVIEALRETNPFMKVVGLTATPYRLGQGMITDGGLFTDVCYDLTDINGFARLLAEGYLAPLYPRPTRTELDVSNVGMSNGDFAKNQLQAAVNDNQTTYKALVELCEAGWNRRAWLIFASGVEHADVIASMLNSFGIPTAAVHQGTKDRDEVIRAYKRGELRCLVNNNVLTTGFDYPPIDLIGMLRPTVSPGLWVQMLGRGTRPWSGGYIDVGDGTQVYMPDPKHDCLVLDFAGNTKRLGPINDPHIPKARKGAPGDAPVRICDTCGTYNHASATVCMCCGAEFPRSENITSKPSDAELMRSDAPVVEYFDVTKVIYSKHESKKGNTSLKASYYVAGGIQRYSEWVHFELGGLPGKRARDWWRQRHETEPPATVDEALMFVSELRTPRRIRVWTNKQYPEVLSYEY